MRFYWQLKAQQQRERMLDERLQSLQMLSEKVYSDAFMYFESVDIFDIFRLSIMGQNNDLCNKLNYARAFWLVFMIY